MKNVWQKIATAVDDGEDLKHTRNTIVMMLLFLAFFGASFYVMVDSLG